MLHGYLKVSQSHGYLHVTWLLGVSHVFTCTATVLPTGGCCSSSRRRLLWQKTGRRSRVTWCAAASTAIVTQHCLSLTLRIGSHAKLQSVEQLSGNMYTCQTHMHMRVCTASDVYAVAKGNKAVMT